ncbi:hypothetical protein LTR94_026808, partial [Friedmanniomyces endolithicus]
MGTSINLRGLGADATLTLVNGRRLAGGGYMGDLADVSAIPSAAVDRVDVLLDGASALYGADAVAGVVNVIMRHSFDGFESRARVAAAQGGLEDMMVSQFAGRTWSSGSALVSYEYQRVKPLNALDRPYTADGDLRRFAGTSQGGIFASPGNIVDYDPSVGAYVPSYAIRPGANGSATSPADFEAGAINFSATLLGADLAPNIERHSLYARARQSFGDRFEMSADVRFNIRDWSVANSPAASTFTVTNANPYFVSPTGASSHQIAYSFYGDLDNPRRGGRNRSLGVTLGGSYALTDNWSLDGYLAFADEREGRDTYGLINSAFLSEALGSGVNSDAVLSFISSGYSRFVDRGRAESANLMLEGSVYDLPGGPVQTAVGVQYRREGFGTRYEALTASVAPVFGTTPLRYRSIAAVFGE